MTHAERLLGFLDAKLNAPVELTLYGRAALSLGFENPPQDYAASRDVDAVLWLGQAEDLARHSNFWEAVAEVNEEFRDQELYLSHLFEEDQVILTSTWRENRVLIPKSWKRLTIYRLGNIDLFVTKLMRDDPLDLADARFVVQRAGLDQQTIERAIKAARVPTVPELQEQFRLCAARFLKE
jgi:hypothetical protein